MVCQFHGCTAGTLHIWADCAIYTYYLVDAKIGLRQDVDMDTTGSQYFYLQKYGTAVKVWNKQLWFSEGINE
jgi:hypothetical protein